MDIPNFHDVFFDGFRVKSDNTTTIFLRTANQKPYELEGNIILDIVFRKAYDATASDIGKLFDADQNTEQATSLLKSTQAKQLKILELNPS
jgi:hypothetical protein